MVTGRRPSGVRATRLSLFRAPRFEALGLGHGLVVPAAAGVLDRQFPIAENLDVLGKDITIRSAFGAASTIIDGSGAAAPTVLYTTGSTRASIFDGFTVRGGSKAGTGPTGMGGGMRLEGSSPTIRNCVKEREAVSIRSSCASSNPNPYINNSIILIF